MAEIVSVVASTHNPRIFWNRDEADVQDIEALEATFAHVRDLLAESRPDVIVVIANDHLDNFFFDNMPTFAVATGAEAEGPFWYETEIMSLPAYKAKIDVKFADFLLRRGVETGMPFSQVQHFRMDHAITLPLSYLRPNRDLPIVPILTNAFGYPIASTRQWYELGQFLARAIREWPGKQRVAVLGSMNLNIEVGGPKAGTYNRVFGGWMLEQMRNGARDEILTSLPVPRLIEEGNSSAEFLNYVALLGIVETTPPDFISHKPVKGVGTCPIAFWKQAPK